MPKKISQDALQRLFHRQYICMKCNAKIKTDLQKVQAGKVKCRKCGYKGLRLKKKELKGAGKA